MSSAGASPASPPDEQAIRAVVAEYGATWNRHDMEAMEKLFTDDAHWVTIVGWHWPGKRDVVAGHEAIHRTFFQETDIALADVEVRAIAPGVATAVVLLKVGAFTPPDGVQRRERRPLVPRPDQAGWTMAHHARPQYGDRSSGEAVQPGGASVTRSDDA
jgi:uncharacterized protein (TIGR02246 family)